MSTEAATTLDPSPEPAVRPGRTLAAPKRGRIRRRLRSAGLAAAAVTPFQFLKRFLYRFIFGYRIARTARLGLCYLDCERLTIGECARIGHGTVFLGCGEVSLGRHVLVGALNLLRGGERIELGDYSRILRLNVINAIPDHDCTNDPRPVFELGYGAVITAEHRIDFTDRVTIGRCVTFGGRNSSIWTHNRRLGLPVEIGDYSYMGSEIRMAPGARIARCCVVGLGSVITKPILEPFSLVAGVPAKRRRSLTESDAELLYGKTRRDLPDEPYPPFPTGGKE